MTWWCQLELRVVQSCNQTVTNNKPPPNFLQTGRPSCHPINSVTALESTTFHKLARANIPSPLSRPYPVQMAESSNQTMIHRMEIN